MRRDSERIPTIRKEYVQTIYDGLKTQFDETMRQQLEDQVDKVQTLESVYQSSFKAQSSIIEFLNKMYNQNNAPQQAISSEPTQQTGELDGVQGQETNSLVIQSMSVKIEQANQVIDSLNASLEELRKQNVRLADELERVRKEKEKESKVYQQKIAHLGKQSGQAQKLKIQLAQLRLANQEKEKLAVSLEEQLEILAKFTSYEQRKTMKMKKKISDREMINKEQLEKLQEFADIETQKSQNLKQFQKCFDSLMPVIEKNTILDRITEQEEEDRYSTNSFASGSQSNQEKMDISQTEKNIKAECESTLSRSETVGKLDSQASNGFVGIRTCRSESQHSNEEEEEKIIDKEIMNLKEQLERKISHQEAEEAEQERKQARVHQNQSRHTSTILQKLQQSRRTSTLYNQKLQQQNAILSKRLETEQFHYKQCLNEQNQKIDELIYKLEELQEQRVRGLSSLENCEAALQEKSSHVDILCGEVEKLREENGEFAELCQKGKEELQSERRKTENLQDEIRELNTQKQKILEQKSLLQAELKYGSQSKNQFKQTLQQRQQQLVDKVNEVTKLSLSLKQSNKKLSQSQETIIELEGNMLGYQKCIDELEARMESKNDQERGYLDQIQRLKKIIKDLTANLESLQKQMQQKQEELDKAINSVKVLEKNAEDLKYMNSLLKKDVMKVKEIEAQDWDKECEETSSNLKGSKILKISNIKEQPDSARSKVYSFTGATSSTQQLKNYPALKTPISRQNLPSYPSQATKINFLKQASGGTKLDMENGSKNSRPYSKIYKQNQYLTERSERPITDLIRKKYMM